MYIKDYEDRGSFLDENQNETKDIIKFSLFGHVVLPSMPKREIFEDNYSFVYCH